jgi:hypothetical protein
MGARFVLRVEAKPGVPGGPSVYQRLRGWLKYGLREFNLRCLDIHEEVTKENTMVNVKKYATGLILPDDVRDGARQERIINVYISDKFDVPVLVFEGGDEFLCWPSNGRVLAKAYGFESEDWRGHVVELSLGNYVDKKDGQTKDTVILKTITSRDGTSNNGGPQRADPAKLPKTVDKDLDDEVPFN